MICITTMQADSYTVITIDGWITRSDLAEIERVRDSIRGKVVLKLGGLETCGADGIRLLSRWLHCGARLETANPFLRMILEKPPRPSGRHFRTASVN